MKRALVLAALALVTCTHAAELVTPTKYRVKSFNYGGSGCPAGSKPSFTFTTATLANLKLPTATKAVWKPGGSIVDTRKFCQVTVEVEHDAKYQYAVRRVSHRGTVQLATGLTGTVKTTAYFQGDANQATATSDFVGPLAKQSFYKQVLVDHQVWSPCGSSSTINIKTDVRVSMGKPTDNGVVEAGSATQFYVIDWRKC